MAFQISEECLACGVCMDECPVEAISEGDDIFVIAATECTDCGSCSEVCPNDSISKAVKA
ncbi:MAG: 4Fe-4S binding protein [Thermoleophilia bacterium]|nr:4Fe-4S binding protein [Thermoleophilia bacterium]